MNIFHDQLSTVDKCLYYGRRWIHLKNKTIYFIKELNHFHFVTLENFSKKAGLIQSLPRSIYPTSTRKCWFIWQRQVSYQILYMFTKLDNNVVTLMESPSKQHNRTTNEKENVLSLSFSIFQSNAHYLTFHSHHLFKSENTTRSSKWRESS